MQEKKIAFFLFIIFFTGVPVFSKKLSSCIECDVLLKYEYYLPLAKLAKDAIEYEENYSLAESLLKNAIDKSRSQLQTDSIIVYGIYFLLLPDLFERDTGFTKNLISELIKYNTRNTNPNLISILNYALSEYHFQLQVGLISYSSSTKILQQGNVFKGIEILALISLAKANEISLDYKSALKNFLSGIYIAEELGDDFYKGLIYKELSNFYSRNNLFNKAYDYKLLELEIKTEDSLEYHYGLLMQLENIRQQNVGVGFSFNDWNNILRFGERHSCKRLISFCFALLRTSYLDAGKSQELLKLYREVFPHYLEELRQSNLGVYLRLLAAYFESMQRVDSAEYYYKAAFDFQTTFRGNFGYAYSLHLRYGDFLVSNGHFSEAENHFLRAKSIADQLNILMYQFQIAGKLRQLHDLGWKSKDQLLFVELYYQLKSKIDSIYHDREIVKMELESNAEILLLKKNLDEEQKHILHQNQYNLIAVIIGIIFIVLLASVQFHVPIWIIRTIGFLAFILLFEYFIIKLDKQIHHITHEVPWKLFTIKVILFSMLLPFHHWLEKKVVHYLVEKRASGGRFMTLNRQMISEWFSNWNRPN